MSFIYRGEIYGVMNVRLSGTHVIFDHTCRFVMWEHELTLSPIEV